MTDNEFTRLQAALNILAYAADCDHYCEEDGCTIEDPKCRDRHLHRAARDLNQILEPPHTGLHPKRLQHGDAERIYSAEWQKENTRRVGINGGYTTIEHILHPEAEMEKERGVFILRHPDRITLRDAEVAATVIQWLGTNVGWSFLDRCEQQIQKAKAVRSSWERTNYQPVDDQTPKTEYRMQAELLAGRLYGTGEPYRRAARALEAALEAAFAAGKVVGADEGRREG